MTKKGVVRFEDLDRVATLEKFDRVLSRGLCAGLGKQGGQVCIEAAWCEVFGLEHSDDPTCVANAVLRFKITLNDCKWTSPQARAVGMRDVGIAQLGSKGIVDDVEFSRALAKQMIKRLIPALFREVFVGNADCLKAADACEMEGSRDSALAAKKAATDAANAAYAAYAAYAANAAAYDAAYDAAAYDATTAAVDAAAHAAHAAAYADAAADADADAAYAAYAANAAYAATKSDKYLILAASIAVDVLKQLNSPGCEWLDLNKE